MGITIADTLTLSNGLTVSNSYACFGRDSISIEKMDTNKYDLRGHACIWTNQTYRNNEAPPLLGVNINLTITASQLDSNIYSLLYTQLKTKYSSTSDV